MAASGPGLIGPASAGGPGRTRHPRAVVRAAVRAALEDLVAGDRVVVGCSGGADSLALSAATVRVCAGRGLVCTVVVVDHGLQQGSADVAARASDQLRILGADEVLVTRVVVAQGPGSGGPEAAARHARRAALCAAARTDPPASAILLGHTRDDQAETVLLGLARGSGARSLAGMAAHDGLWRRPLLGLPRSVVACAAEADAQDDPRLTPWSDPHNLEARFARVRVRTGALPALVDALGPHVVAALARTAELARDDADALAGWAQRALADMVVDGDAGMLRADRLTPGHPDALPRAVGGRVVRLWLLNLGCAAGGLTHAHVQDVLALAERPGAPHGRGEVALPGGLRAHREGDCLVVRR